MVVHATDGPTRWADTTYLLPIRSSSPHTDELTDYLRRIARQLPVVVVDGSPAEVFAAVHEEWSAFAAHVAPDPDIGGSNGKVRGVLTGVRRIDTEFVVIGDDDVRYSLEALCEVRAALQDADLVMPQNVFAPQRWHTRWDSARILINRATDVDPAGTLGVRRRYLDQGYNADVLFENLELIRTVARRGGRCRWRGDLFVERRPPTTQHFLGQRTRHAYDEFARPIRLVAGLLVPPAVLVGVRRPAVLAVVIGAAIGVAEFGRRRDGGRSWFSPVSSVLAPIWLLERGLCSWAAVALRLTGGVRYAGTRMLRATSDDGRLRAPQPWAA